MGAPCPLPRWELSLSLGKAKSGRGPPGRGRESKRGLIINLLAVVGFPHRGLVSATVCISRRNFLARLGRNDGAPTPATNHSRPQSANQPAPRPPSLTHPSTTGPSLTSSSTIYRPQPTRQPATTNGPTVPNLFPFTRFVVFLRFIPHPRLRHTEDIAQRGLNPPSD